MMHPQYACCLLYFVVIIYIVIFHIKNVSVCSKLFAVDCE